MKHFATPMMALVCIFVSGCMVGPKYVKPSAPFAPAYKESYPVAAQDGWKVSQPADMAQRGEWWEVFNDQQLSALESRLQLQIKASKLQKHIFVKRAP
jgi:outer membrane protein TolC